MVGSFSPLLHSIHLVERRWMSRMPTLFGVLDIFAVLWPYPATGFESSFKISAAAVAFVWELEEEMIGGRMDFASHKDKDTALKFLNLSDVWKR